MSKSEKQRAYEKQWHQVNARKSRDWTLKYKYGIGIDDYEEMLQRQDSVCAICGMPEEVKENGRSMRQLAVDHDASTGKVRGLLCFRCNIGIGQLRHDRNLLLAAVEYLDKSRYGE